jgi:hypothetical protein
MRCGIPSLTKGGEERCCKARPTPEDGIPRLSMTVHHSCDSRYPYVLAASCIATNSYWFGVMRSMVWWGNTLGRVEASCAESESIFEEVGRGGKRTVDFATETGSKMTFAPLFFAACTQFQNPVGDQFASTTTYSGVEASRISCQGAKSSPAVGAVPELRIRKSAIATMRSLLASLTAIYCAVLAPSFSSRTRRPEVSIPFASKAERTIFPGRSEAMMEQRRTAEDPKEEILAEESESESESESEEEEEEEEE